MFGGASRPLRAVVGHRKRPLGACNVNCATPDGSRCGGRLHTGSVYRVAASAISRNIMENDENSFLSGFAVSASLSHRQRRSLSMVVKSAYLADEARIGRKMTGESSGIDPVWFCDG